MQYFEVYADPGDPDAIPSTPQTPLRSPATPLQSSVIQTQHGSLEGKRWAQISAVSCLTALVTRQ